jgi:DNA polymerase-3 subunit delta'
VTAAADPTASPLGPPAPRENPELVGHEAAERRLLEAWGRGRLGHAWMITGPRGVGKATLAFRLARALLATDGMVGGAAPASLYLAPDHPTFRRVAAASHAGLMVVERTIDPKKKDLDPRKNKLRSEIVISDVRRLIDFLHLAAGEGGWRVAVIDSADELNRNAANALLKVLEEPPERALLLLVAHAPGRVPATLRSRCRKLELRPLEAAAIAELLARHFKDLDEGERLALARLAEGSAGRAFGLAAAGGLELYGEMITLLEGLPRLEVPALHAFAERLARPNAEPARGGARGRGVDGPPRRHGRP